MSSSTTPHSYAIPQWLIPEKQAVKFFSLALPAVPKQTEKAIRSRLKRQYSNKEFKESAKLIHTMSQLQHDEKQANHRVKAAKEKLASALSAKAQGIAELRKSSEADAQKALENLERSMRKDQEKECRTAREKLRAVVRAEYEQRFEEEREKKRRREAQQPEEEDDETSNDDRRAKRQKSSNDDGTTTTTEGGDEKEGSHVVVVSESALLERKRGELQEKMERLSERKSEMFWLLKQVIMQESKQKIALMKQKNQLAPDAS